MFKKLTLKYLYSKHDMWGKYLLHLLSLNDNVSVFRDMSLSTIPVFKSKNLIPFKLDDFPFFIDDWDYSYPTSYLDNPKVLYPYLKNNLPPTILKIQYSSNHKEKYDNLYNKYNIKVLPFIIFPNRYFNLGFDKWDSNKQHKYLCFHTGRQWRERSRWINYLKNNISEIPQINTKLTTQEYQSLLLDTKWGLVLKGKGIGKNRREIEYMSIGMPLVLNYKPEYPFPYNANEHYVYLEKPKDIEKLKDIDPEPYAKKSLDIYNRYYNYNSGGLYHSFNIAYVKSLFNIDIL